MKGLSRNWFAATLLALCLFRAAGGAEPNGGEVHHGYGGFAITPLVETTAVTRMQEYSLDGYRAWGGAMFWTSDKHELSVALFSIVNERSSYISANDRPLVLAKWKSAFLKEIAAEKATIKELPYAFGESKGYELQIAGELKSVVRVFFVNNTLFTVSLSVKDEADRIRFCPLLDSFRLLSKDDE